MSHRLRILAMAGVLVAGAAAAVIATAPSASADTQICDQFGTTTIGGRYVVMNNRWGSSQPQCINVTSTGFSITQQDGTGNLSGAPVSYPAVYLGCHYTNCSPGSPLPMQISRISSANTSISNSYPSSGTFDAAYDIWLNANTDVSGVQDTEIMVWLNHTGSIQPVGSNTGQTVNVAGRSWQVWTGNNGQNNVVSYVQAGISSLSFNVMDFIRDTLNRGSQYGTNSWYLTSIQAGFEPWIGGVGLAVNNFSATINGGGGPTGGQTSGPPGGQTSSPPNNGSGGCSATYTTVNSWQGGFQGEVTVRNTGSSSISGWTVTGTLSGASITQLWNGQLSGNFTVRNMSYNGSISGGGTTSFGFIGSGSAPNSLSLSCTAS